MKEIMINVLGTIILIGIGAFLFITGLGSNGIARDILDFLMIRGVLYVIAVISLLVIVDAKARKISYCGYGFSVYLFFCRYFCRCT